MRTPRRTPAPPAAAPALRAAPCRRGRLPGHPVPSRRRTFGATVPPGWRRDAETCDAETHARGEPQRRGARQTHAGRRRGRLDFGGKNRVLRTHGERSAPKRAIRSVRAARATPQRGTRPRRASNTLYPVSTRKAPVSTNVSLCFPPPLQPTASLFSLERLDQDSTVRMKHV